MATDTRIDNSAAIAACDAIVDLLDGGTVLIYTGSAPSDVDASATGTLLGTLTLGSPAFGNAADAAPGATATANAITGDASADATGTAGYFRALTSGAAAIIQGTCGTSNADMILNTVSIEAGAAIDITSWTVTMPES